MGTAEQEVKSIGWRRMGKTEMKRSNSLTGCLLDAPTDHDRDRDVLLAEVNGG
jgi:hypothetical protein